MKQARTFISVIAACVIFAALTIQLFRMRGLGWGELFSDPAEIGRYPVSTGLFTYLGVLSMAMTAAVLVFSALRLTEHVRDDLTNRRILFVAALLSALLTIDDLFQFHERILRSTFGIHETLVYAVYAVIGLGILLMAGRRCFSAEFTGLWIAAGLLVFSVVADVMEDKKNPSAIQLLAEEVSKFCGLTVWLVFWWKFSGAALDRTANVQALADR